MPTQILAVGTAAADSADVVVASGSTLTVALKDSTGPAAGGDGGLVMVSLKDDAGQYFTIDKLDNNKPALVLSSGTWRLSRIAGASCGAFSA